MLWSRARAPVLLFYVFLLSLVTRGVRRWLKPPVVWSQVHLLLTELQKFAFKTELENAAPVYEHRVTLFRRGWRLAPCRWPWSGWLIPVERSGHMTRTTNTVFRAEEASSKVEGIAGYTWARSAIVSVGELPDLEVEALRRLEPNLQTEAIDEYAQRTLVTPEVVRQRIAEGKTLARSYCGIPVEVRGKMWGVIVIDSRNPEAKAGSG